MPEIKRQKRAKKKSSKKSNNQEGVLGRIVNLDDVPDIGINLCVYGVSGTGKTRFMSTFSECGKLLHLVCSSIGINEARSIRGVKNIDVVEITCPEDLGDIIQHLRNSEEYATVALDHVTGFCDCTLANIMGIERVPEQGSWGMAKRDDYAQMGLKTKTYLRELFDLSQNTIIIGQERAYGVTEDNNEIISPYVSVSATPTVAGWIAPAVDYMVHTFKREGFDEIEKKVGTKKIKKKQPNGKIDFCLRVGPSDKYITKFRVPPGLELPDIIVDPSYKKIKHLIG